MIPCKDLLCKLIEKSMLRYKKIVESKRYEVINQDGTCHVTS